MGHPAISSIQKCIGSSLSRRPAARKTLPGFIQNDSGGVDAIVVMDRLGVPKISIKNCPTQAKRRLEWATGLRREKHCRASLQNDSGGVDAIVAMDQAWRAEDTQSRTAALKPKERLEMGHRPKKSRTECKTDPQCRLPGTADDFQRRLVTGSRSWVAPIAARSPPLVAD